jgi:hypothetical protein
VWTAAGNSGKLDLARFVNGQKNSASVVWGISFSPDESKVAVGFGPYPSGFGPNPQHVVILPVGSPSTVLQEFDVRLENYVVSTFAWAPSGTALVVGDRMAAPIILSLDKEPACTFPGSLQFGGFLRDDLMVVTGPDSEVRILRRDCSLVKSWKTAADTRVLGTSPEQDLIAILDRSADGSSVTELSSGTHEAKQRWIRNAAETLAAFRGGFHFADQGRLFCSGYDPGNELNRTNVQCRDTQSGSIVATNTNVVLWNGSIHSSGGQLLAITDYSITEHTGKVWQLLDSGGEFITSRRRLIWNIRTGKEIASWKGPTIRPNFVFALSPNAKYAAEGGSGSVQVYALQP